MRNSILIFLVIGIVMIFIGCSENNALNLGLSQNDQIINTLAKKPAPNLTGEAHTPFSLNNPPFFWSGIVVFDGDTYGITYETLTELRNYSSASPFSENWVVYEEGNPGNVYMRGSNHGLSNTAQIPDPTPFVGNGTVEEAYGSFEMWLGRNVHEQGLIYWKSDGSIPDSASFTIRIN
jgi:hypothetical protein